MKLKIDDTIWLAGLNDNRDKIIAEQYRITDLMGSGYYRIVKVDDIDCSVILRKWDCFAIRKEVAIEKYRKSIEDEMLLAEDAMLFWKKVLENSR